MAEVAAVPIFALIFAACAHVDFPAQSVTPVPVGTAKLPLKVAVLADSSLTLHPLMEFYEKLNPGLADTIRDALTADFEKVGVTDNGQSVGDADLLAIPNADIHFYARTFKLTVRFVVLHTGKTIAEFSSVKPIDAHAPGTRDHLGTDLAIAAPSLLLPPLIILGGPTLQRHDAERFNAGFGPALVAMATDIAAQALKDPAIKSMPRGARLISAPHPILRLTHK